jgi:hypothetical protein
MSTTHPISQPRLFGFVNFGRLRRGDEISAARADHVDLNGQFDDERNRPPHHAWIEARSQVARRDFEQRGNAVACYGPGAAAA